MVALQNAESILNSPSCEQGSLAFGMLPIQIQFRCPPAPRAVFELRQITPERGHTSGPAPVRLIADFQLSFLLHVIAVSHKVRILFSVFCEGRSRCRKQVQSDARAS